MSHSIEDRISTDIEYTSATNWQAVLAAVVLAVMVVAGLGLAVLLAPGPKPAPPERELCAMSGSAPASRTDSSAWWLTLPRKVSAATPEEQVTELIPVPNVAEPVVRVVVVPVPESIPVPSLAPPPPQPVAESVRKVDAPPAWLLWRRAHPRGEQILVELLQFHSTELDLESVKGATKELLQKAAPRSAAAHSSETRDKPTASTLNHVTLDLVAQRPDLAGLPLRGEKECQLDDKAARSMLVLSGQLRASLLTGPDARRPTYQDPELELAHQEAELCKTKEWNSTQAVPTVAQLIPGQEPRLRLALVGLMARVEGPEASAALARLAVFDVSPEVRAGAIRILKERPRKETRQVFLDALRYPWPPVADHAAEALAALQDREAVPGLVELLDRPDPSAPYPDADKRLVVPQLVRVNHFRNCLLCHAPSFSSSDPLRGAVPTPGRPIPTREYYDRNAASVVRADVTYLKQDFAALHPVDNAHPWPNHQRFDYMIRARKLTAEEEKTVREAQKNVAFSDSAIRYPQQEAVLQALYELTGKDAGTRARDWQPVLQELATTDKK